MVLGVPLTEMAFLLGNFDVPGRTTGWFARALSPLAVAPC
jgi:hypothetical protein